MNNLLEIIQDLCKKENITIAALERQCGLGNATIKKWASSIPSGDKLMKVAEFFNVSVDFLLGSKKNMSEIFPEITEPLEKLYLFKVEKKVTYGESNREKSTIEIRNDYNHKTDNVERLGMEKQVQEQLLSLTDQEIQTLIIANEQEIEASIKQVCELLKPVTIKQALLSELDRNQAIREKKKEIEDYIEKEKHQFNQFSSMEGYNIMECQRIENATYHFIAEIRDNRGSWNQCKNTQFQVSYDFSLNSSIFNTPDGRFYTRIKHVDKRGFKTLEEAQVYMQGRIKAYEKYFQEEKPAIVQSLGKACNMYWIKDYVNYYGYKII